MVLALIAISKVLYNIFLHPLRRIPGPLLFGSSRLPYVYCALTGQLAITLKRLHDRYGPVVRTASNEVSFIETSGWNTIYARKDGDGHVFPKNFDTFPETENLFPRTVFASNFADYVNLRKVLSPSFSEANLGHFEPRLLGHADKLLQSIEAERERRGDVDLSEMAHWMAFDVATDFVTGESFNSLSDPNSFFRGWLRQLSETWRFISFVSNVKQMTNALTLLQSIIPASVLQKRVDQLKPVEDSIRENLNQRSSGSSLLSNVQRLKSDTAEKAMGLSEPELVANAALIIVAGTDTVALMLPAIIHLVLRNESVHAKLISEIRGAYAADKQISSASAKKLPYLNACIQEAMRVYPATPEGLPRIVPGDGENICGHWVPGGTCVQVSVLAAFRSATNFDQPDSFVPERWLRCTQADGSFASDRRSACRPFSMGPRTCLGQSLAMSEMCVVIAKLFWHFDIGCLADEDWLEQSCYLLWRQKPLPLRENIARASEDQHWPAEETSSA